MGSCDHRSALIGKATLSASLAHRDMRPILFFEYVGNWKPAKILSKEMNLPLDNYTENRGDNYCARKINSRSDKWERAMKSAYAVLSRLEENPPETISELRVGG
jgi:hypothetical protein